MDQEQQAFIDSVLGYARQAASELNIPTSVVLAQWADETGWGTSTLFRESFNFAGVYGDADGQTHRVGARVLPSGFLAYPDHEAGVRGYVMRWQDPVYTNTRNAWHADNRPIPVAKAVEASPWASGHYNFRDLEVIIEDHNLFAYDDPNTGPGPVDPPEDPPCSTLPVGPAPNGLRTLRVGMRGNDVAELQADLARYGLGPADSMRSDGKWDGIFGPHTATQVVAFQNLHGLRPDGIVGRQTWCALGVR